MTDKLPDNTGYVAAAYLVFLALILVYVVIMAVKLSRFERELSELNDLADARLAQDEQREAVPSQQQRVVARPTIAGNLDTEPSQ